MMLFKIIKHQGIGAAQHLLQVLHPQEYVVDGILRLVAELHAFHLVAADLPVDDGRYHIVFIRKELVDGLFGDAQLRGDLVHGNGTDPVSHEEIGRLAYYPFFYVHFFCIHFPVTRGHNFGRSGGKTKETFFVTKVSCLFLAVIYLFNPKIRLIFGLQTAKMSINSVKQLRDFDSFFELVNYFSIEQKCVEYLATLRWNGVIECPYCAHDTCYVLNGAHKRFKCAKCRKQFSVRVGTIFEDSKIELRKWFFAIFLFTAHKKGISSHQLARDLKITQKSAWFMLQRIREAFTHDEATE